jgi:GTP-binding protein
MDLPGLIEGTSEGKGVGTKFLKHTQYSKILIHCISIEDENLVERYTSMREEFERISPTLSGMEEIVVLTKSDIFTPERSQEISKRFSKDIGKEVVLVSTYLEDDMEKLKIVIKSKLDSL